MDQPKPVRRGAAAVVAVAALVVAGCGDQLERADVSDEPTIEQPAVDEILTDGP